MTVFDLDLKLEEKEDRYTLRRDRILQRFYSDGAYTTRYDNITRNRTITETEKVFYTDLPEKADMFHINYLSYLNSSYAMHRKIVLTPDIFWYTITCEIAKHVKKFPEEHRSLFTRQPGKVSIIVPCSSEEEPLRMDAIYDKLMELVPTNTKAFLPKFSTTTENSRMATLAAFLETCSPYYNYMMLLCGFISIKVTGTLDDWDKLYECLNELIVNFNSIGSSLAHFLTFSVAPIVLGIIEALKRKDSEFFKDIFYDKRCGSGHDAVDGWFTKMFMEIPNPAKVDNFSSHITVVPYTTLPSGRNWNMVFALAHSNKDKDGFLVPEFSRAQMLKLPNPVYTTIEPQEPILPGYEVYNVKANTRTLKAEYTIEQSQDLEAVHSIGEEEED